MLEHGVGQYNCRAWPCCSSWPLLRMGSRNKARQACIKSGKQVCASMWQAAQPGFWHPKWVLEPAVLELVAAPGWWLGRDPEWGHSSILFFSDSWSTSSEGLFSYLNFPLSERPFAFSAWVMMPAPSSLLTCKESDLQPCLLSETLLLSCRAVHLLSVWQFLCLLSLVVFLVFGFGFLVCWC